MKKVRITVKKLVRHDELVAEYENPIEHTCDMQAGQTFICSGLTRPEGLCRSAWETMFPFVKTLAYGGGNFYDGWMKNPKSAMISCNDGFRPVSFLIEALEEEAENDIVNNRMKSGTDIHAAAEKIKKTLVYPDGHSEQAESAVISEHELEVFVNEQPVYRLVCTKGSLRELVCGRLLTDGIVGSIDDIKSVHFCESENRARVFLSKDITWQKYTGTEPTCCTGNRVFAYAENKPEITPMPPYDYKPEWVFGLATEFGRDTKLHGMTGGNHICMLAREGRTLFVCEDIGRHNAVDKAVGFAILNRIPLCECMVFTSGRVPVDMAEKIIAARIPVLVSKSVPTAESVELAKRYGLNLICRAWPDKFEIY